MSFVGGALQVRGLAPATTARILLAIGWLFATVSAGAYLSSNAPWQHRILVMLLVGLPLARAVGSPDGKSQLPSLDAVLTHKQDELRRFIRERRDSEALGWRVPQAVPPGTQSFETRVERFLLDYFDVFYVQRFRDKGVLALEEIQKELLLNQNQSEPQKEGAVLKWKMQQLSQDILWFLAQRKNAEPSISSYKQHDWYLDASMRHGKETQAEFMERFDLRIDEVKRELTNRGHDWSRDMDITHIHVNPIAMRSGAIRLSGIASHLDY